MKKDLGVKPFLFPMPVLMIATYGDNDKVDVMNMAWGGICDNNKVALNITETHKTAENIKKRGAFTISVADVAHLEESDFFGTASGNTIEDKFERTNMLERQAEGIEIAKREGKYKKCGRKKKEPSDGYEDLIQQYVDGSITKVQLAVMLNVSRPTLNRILKEYGEDY